MCRLEQKPARWKIKFFSNVFETFFRWFQSDVAGFNSKHKYTITIRHEIFARFHC